MVALPDIARHPSRVVFLVLAAPLSTLAGVWNGMHRTLRMAGFLTAQNPSSQPLWRIAGAAFTLATGADREGAARRASPPAPLKSPR